LSYGAKKCTTQKHDSKKNPAFPHFFSDLKDPRRTTKGNHLYPLNEILFLCISAVISGADNWTSISLFGRSKISWLRKFSGYKNGVPSQDVFGMYLLHWTQMFLASVLLTGSIQ